MWHEWLKLLRAGKYMFVQNIRKDSVFEFKTQAMDQLQILDNSEKIEPDVPMTEDDLDTLNTIYQKRVRFFLPVFLMMLGLALWFGLSYGSFKGYKANENFGITTGQLEIIDIACLEIVVFIMGAFIYVKSIGCIKRDFQRRLKQPIVYHVVQKRFFENTGQYFVGLNNPKCLFQEVDAMTWNQVNVGSEFVVFRAPKSKYIFNPRGQFSII